MQASNIEGDIAIFAGGCFWCTEAAFHEAEGVLEIAPGYIGGHAENPTYEQVCGGKTGHTEAVRILFDPKRITYPELLEIFWRSIDPTDAGGQFYDRGPQYRTAIFALNEEQKAQAEVSRREVEQRLGHRIVTAVEPAGEFHVAEEYHHGYYRTHAMRYDMYKKGSGRERKLGEIWGE